MAPLRVHPVMGQPPEAAAPVAAPEEAEEVALVAAAPAFRADKENPYALASSVHVHEDEEEHFDHHDADDALDDVREDGDDDDRGGGRVWHAQIIRDDFRDPKHCDAAGRLKPRRPLPQIRAGAFFAGVARAADGRYVFDGGGPLNGWPGLAEPLEVLAITCRVRGTLRSVVKRFWDSRWADGAAPTFPDRRAVKSVRATLRAPAWTARGYVPRSPGFCFWVTRRDGALACFPGRAMVAAANDARATRCHLFAHRYSKARESAKDLLTYHAAVLFEWDDGTATVCELAWLHGLGGYGGRCNWLPAASAGEATELIGAMPAAMQAPWRSELCEVRLVDVDFTDRAQLEAYLARFAGRRPTDRFLDPKVQHSGDVRLAFRTKKHIFEMILNYQMRDAAYHEESRNCQTFAADLYGFAAGKKGIEPYSQVCRVLYKPRPHLFLYDPDQYA